MLAKPPTDWTRVDSESDVPLWRHDSDPVYVATRDSDLLLFLGVALRRFADMEPREFIELVTGDGRRTPAPEPGVDPVNRPGCHRALGAGDGP